MEYKVIIEEQIKGLQKIQARLIETSTGREHEACEVAKTIAELCFTAKQI